MLAPGCYDALIARLVEEAGFPAAYMTGFGSSAGYLGRPDVGLMTMADMVDNARRIVDAVDIPVIADADTVCAVIPSSNTSATAVTKIAGLRSIDGPIDGS